MKKWVWVVATIVVALLIGGYAYSNHHATAKEYAAAMDNGRTALKAKNYTQAESYFQNALKRKLNDPTAQTYLTQTQRFVSGENALTARKFRNAQGRYQKVSDTKNGSDVLTKRAKQRLKQVKGIRANVTQFKELLTKAQEQNQALNYGVSNNTLDELFNNKKFQQSYYKNLYNQALALRKANNAGQTAAITKSGSTAASTSSSDTSNSSTGTSDSNANSSSASLTSSESAAAKNYKGKNEYTVTKKQTELNGKVITDAQISAARQTINAAGGQADAMSNQDVRVALQQADKKGISLTKYTQTYLK
ncbi:MAG TPA: hypothetical protein H9875_01030 [Candidatus Levilactobacillus faecigallinarum]|uniref:Uncharacterized protein n=1 Tax=Candidatus Levilactobacillus faecigallinarum TaxID=2838638 RepID=A0A9D1QS62_9LACO|nr:hypothetical protein [Candidatus Levilactobacillus faecigallinarum]